MESPNVHLYHHIHMSFSMLGLFIAFSSMQNLVSSLNGELGFWSLATIYTLLCISSILVGPFVVTYLKPKYSLVVGSMCYVSFIIANKWPTYGSLITTGALVGIGGSILWTAQGTYLTQCSGNYARKKGEDRKSTMGYFNGIFFAVFQANQIVGNLIASVILNDKSDNSTTILSYVFISTAGISFLSFFFLASEDQPIEDADTSSPQVSSPITSINITQKLFSAIVLIKDMRLLLLLPIIFYSGVEQGFIFGSYTSNFIKKTIGQQQIGYVMTTFGAVNVAGSFLFGKLADKFGTSALAIVGFIAHLTCLCTLFLILSIENMQFFDSHSWLLFVVAGLWGLGDASWNTFPNIMLSMLFIDDAEAAFANLKFWQSLGTVLPFAAGAYLSIEVQLVSVFGFLLFGVISLLYLELLFGIFSNKAKITVINEETTPLRKSMITV